MKTFLKIIGIVSVVQAIAVLWLYFLDAFVVPYLFGTMPTTNINIPAMWVWFVFGFASLAIGATILLTLEDKKSKKK